MKQSHALAHLRQLCCSGLSREIVIAEFLHAVSMLIPSNNNTFSGSEGNTQLKPTFHITGFDCTDLFDVIPVVVADFHTPERQDRAMAWFAQHPVISDPRVMDEAFYKTDLYHLIYRKFDMHHVLWAPTQREGKSNGVLGLYRSRSQKPFNHSDQALLMRVLPYVSHALQAANDEALEYSSHGASGMLILDTQGNILYHSPEAKYLLQQARYPQLLMSVRKQDHLLAKLAQLCRDLNQIYRGRDAAPPSYCHIGPKGQFTFRAYWLDKQNSEPGSLVGMTIKHQEPITLKILRAMCNLPLSPMQREVTLLLAQGVLFEQISQRLHIKLTTVKDHADKIYTKLGIHQREALLPKLLAANI
ncbi:MAG TPA: helix-turn-helix transcriptional regulator [Candidatus Competibacteraceae bacterium]|nr:helix-turn-helix transcriptional regulator [Candidatus Competibacteraceae bacterium]MCP5134728.1 helix-turn-helix transcriptional regulator [Gammaproteobacteria bacterium]HPF59856.1 helix-turn-helix transcriptional regulator [Candidatus Competibacteraceae bacterium]HRY18788.1 helix-turn-helix transcriptional regulator [Candidatus Competibacteraceae bacterium]